MSIDGTARAFSEVPYAKDTKAGGSGVDLESRMLKQYAKDR